MRINRDGQNLYYHQYAISKTSVSFSIFLGILVFLVTGVHAEEKNCDDVSGIAMLSMLRLAQKYGDGVFDLKISDLRKVADYIRPFGKKQY